MDEREFLRHAHSQKDSIRKKILEALDEHGLSGFDIGSITLYVKRGRRQCPEGQTESWEAVTRPDGTVEYTWVCR
jgi:hypothetical protein